MAAGREVLRVQSEHAVDVGGCDLAVVDHRDGRARIDTGAGVGRADAQR